MDMDMLGSASDVAAVDRIAPPGEEFEISHEGRKVEVFEDLASEIATAIG